VLLIRHAEKNWVRKYCAKSDGNSMIVAFRAAELEVMTFPHSADVSRTRLGVSAPDASAAFTEFVEANGVRLRRILTARYGVEAGGDIYGEAMTWAWQHWERLQPMDNPVGYLYRVAQSSSRPHRRWLKRNSFPAKMPERWHVDQDSELFASLGSLSEAQRVSVLMVHGYSWTYAEVGEVLGCSVAAVTNHVHRGLATLRKQLGEDQGEAK
jgi:RNA polymerase sigma-70 factor, ECF subfamily